MNSCNPIVMFICSFSNCYFWRICTCKTEMMLISSMHLPPVEVPQFLVGDETIMPVDSFRNLGVQFDSKMCLQVRNHNF